MRSFIFPLSLSLSAFFLPSNAVRIPLTGHVANNTETRSLFGRRIPIDNRANVQYTVDLNIAGTDYPLLLDSGSSDLWINFDEEPANTSELVDTGKDVYMEYALGNANGRIIRTNIGFANHTLKDQVFAYVEDPTMFVKKIDNQAYRGVFGIGPNTGSLVRKKMGKKNADTVLQNIFKADNKTSGNYVTIMMDRVKDVSDPYKGEMTIGEIIPGLERITSQPRLDVETVTRLLRSDQHWQALADKDNGITGPDGKTIEVDSIVPRAPDGHLVAVIDSGFTFSQVPREVADAIYGRVPGAVYDNHPESEYWVVPCNQYINIAFNFGGVVFPIHPLDTVDNNLGRTDASGRRVCLGSFQPITSAFSMLGHYDMILGMNFLRSAYTLLDFGNWIESSDEDLHPYVQMLPLVDVEEARRDFVTVRLGGEDTIDTDPARQLLPFDQTVHSPVSDEEKKKKYQEMVLSRWPYILMGCLAFVILMVGLCVWKCCCKRKKDSGVKKNKRLGFGNGKSEEDRKPEEDAYNRGEYSSGNNGRLSYMELGSSAYLPQNGHSNGQQQFQHPQHSHQLERQQSHHSSNYNNHPPSPGYHPSNQLQRQPSHQSSINSDHYLAYPQHANQSQQQFISPYQNDYSSSNLELQQRQPQQPYDSYGHGYR